MQKANVPPRKFSSATWSALSSPLPDDSARAARAVVLALRSQGCEADRAGMARFGIAVDKALGVRIPVLRAAASDLLRLRGRDPALARALWATAVHEARILASMVQHPAAVDEAVMEAWAADFDSWDLCDQVCANCFQDHALAWDKALEWCAREQEFVKRAGFVLMARLAVSRKQEPDERFHGFFPAVHDHCADNRVYVKKSASWALRQMGKRSRALNAMAATEARALRLIDHPAARWIASDVLRELTAPKTLARLQR
jgi:3-methyladenine DNA glycosylase AlkD